MILEQKYKEAIIIASDLFSRGHVTGSGGNLSFKDGDIVYITRSGSSFGHLTKSDFAKVRIDGEIIEGKPSKELPIHLQLYRCDSKNEAVIHTHGFYMTLLSCLDDSEMELEELFSYTPYLKMQSGGQIGSVEYAPPGSDELFDRFAKVVRADISAYIMKNHGGTVAGASLSSAFNLIEELETTARLYLEIKKIGITSFRKIVR